MKSDSSAPNGESREVEWELIVDVQLLCKILELLRPLQILDDSVGGFRRVPAKARWQLLIREPLLQPIQANVTILVSSNKHHEGFLAPARVSLLLLQLMVGVSEEGGSKDLLACAGKVVGRKNYTVCGEGHELIDSGGVFDDIAAKGEVTPGKTGVVFDFVMSKEGKGMVREMLCNIQRNSEVPKKGHMSWILTSW